MIDTELVTRKMLLITKDVEALQGLADMTPEVFLATRSTRYSPNGTSNAPSAG